MIDAKIISVDVEDIRFPSSLKDIGSDAMHDDDRGYSCAYVSIYTDYVEYTGHGLTCAVGRRNEIVVQACKLISKLLIDKSTKEIYSDFGSFWNTLVDDLEVKSINIERGVASLAKVALGNTLWDLWARIENKPVWKLLMDMTPERLVSNINLKYVNDFLTEEEAIQMLRKNEEYKEEQEKKLKRDGYPSYISNVGSVKYSNQKIKDTCRNYVKLDFNMFKLALHKDMRETVTRCKVIRELIGWKKRDLILDANQVAFSDRIKSMDMFFNNLQQYKPFWIEALQPDIVATYASKELRDKLKDIKLAGGETYGNCVEIKQIIKKNTFNLLQINLARLTINDALAVYLMAEKNKTPICPHTGGLGLCEMAQHLQMWDFICLSQSTKNRSIEFIDYKHGYFVNPVHIVNGRYMPPTLPGYSTMFKKKAIQRWSYPSGSRWQHLFDLGFPTNFQCKKQHEEEEKRTDPGDFPAGQNNENEQTERKKKEEPEKKEEIEETEETEGTEGKIK